MQLMTTEDAIIQILTAAHEHGHPARTGYQLAAGMNMVHSALHPTLEDLRWAGRIVRLDAAVAVGVEEMPGDQRWAIR
jgi:hypothetical protein